MFVGLLALVEVITTVIFLDDLRSNRALLAYFIGGLVLALVGVRVLRRTVVSCWVSRPFQALACNRERVRSRCTGRAALWHKRVAGSGAGRRTNTRRRLRERAPDRVACEERGRG
jgi:hypothetical protein